MIEKIITGLVGVVAGMLIAIGANQYDHAPDRDFDKFLTENKCKTAVDFGKPVFVRTPNEGFTPGKIQHIYLCQKYPDVAILD